MADIDNLAAWVKIPDNILLLTILLSHSLSSSLSFPPFLYPWFSIPLSLSLSVSTFLSLSLYLCLSFCLSLSLFHSSSTYISFSLSLSPSLPSLSLFLFLSIYFSFSPPISVSLSLPLSLSLSLSLSLTLSLSLPLSIGFFLGLEFLLSASDFRSRSIASPHPRLVLSCYNHCASPILSPYFCLSAYYLNSE